MLLWSVGLMRTRPSVSASTRVSVGRDGRPGFPRSRFVEVTTKQDVLRLGRNVRLVQSAGCRSAKVARMSDVEDSIDQLVERIPGGSRGEHERTGRTERGHRIDLQNIGRAVHIDTNVYPGVIAAPASTEGCL